VTNDVMTVRHGILVPFVTIAQREMIVPRVMTASLGTPVPFVMIVRPAMTVAQRAMTVRRVTIVPRVTTVFRGTHVPFETTVRPATTVAPLGMIVLRAMTALPATNAPPAAIRISIRRATKRRSTSPAMTSCSTVCRRWPRPRKTSTV
jgi:hypothetical protein